MSRVTWLPTLYTFDNKRVLRSYQIGYSKDGVIHTETAIVRKTNGLPGVVMSKERQIEANARAATRAIAAANYAQNEWKKKQRIGRYRESDHVPKDSEYTAWALSDTRKWPAVCLDWKDAKDSDTVCSLEQPWMCQPKFNGVRTTAWLENGEVKLFSRNCREINFRIAIRENCKHVFAALKNKYGLTNVGLDGEVFVPDISFQDSMSVAARSVNRHPDEDKLLFVIFDIVEYTMPFSKRTKIVEGVKQLLPDLENISLCGSVTLHSYEDIIDFVATCDEHGFDEGIVLRRPDILYTKKKNYKHGNMLKLKNFDDAEFEVIGFKAAEGTRVGCVVWHCRDLEDKSIVFWCSMTGTEEYQRELFAHGNDYIGKLLTVKFLNRTDDGKPFHPVGLYFRDESDLPDYSEEELVSDEELVSE